MSAPGDMKSSPQRLPHLPLLRRLRHPPNPPHTRRSLSCTAAAKKIVYVHVTLRCPSPPLRFSYDVDEAAGD